jgi:predicted HicB family RNase H-like nuclease
MSKTKILNLRIDPDLKRRAKAIAQEDGRTLSNWVTHLIEREVKKIRKEKEK